MLPAISTQHFPLRSMFSTSCSCSQSIMCSSACLSAIVLLHTFTCTLWFLELTLVNGAIFTVVNNCTQTIWPAISGIPPLDTTGFELPVGGTRVLQAPKRWQGRFWGRTGCTFNATGRGSCVTGNCGSNQIECNGNGPKPTAITLAEFAIDSLDFYDISLVNGFNLPMLIEGKNGSGQRCESTGCIEDLNRMCPAELRAKTGHACQSACDVFRTSLACGPSMYSQLFKYACPTAFSFPTDDDTALFTCSSGDYVITFCPSPLSLQNEKCTRPFQCGGISNISYPFWGANRPDICGFPGFELLNCQGDVPMLNIDSINYTVLEIDYSSQTLKVARQDLWNNTCPTVLYNTTFDQNLFSFPLKYNVTLYYNCTQDQYQVTTVPADQGSQHFGPPVWNRVNHINQFTCNIDRGATLNFFAVGKSSELGSNVKCNNYISVPVNQSAAQTLSTDSASVKDLQDALASGFSIRWLDIISSCYGCVQSGGVCGYNLDSASITCSISHSMLKVDPIIALSPSPPFSSVAGNEPGYGLAPAPSSSPPFSFFVGNEPGYGESGLSFVKKVLTGTAIIATVAIPAFIVSYIRIKRRFKRLQLGLNQETTPNVENFLLNHENLSPKRYKYSDIERITKSFSDKLGQGGYGSVYKGTLPNGQFVAVKLLTETKSNGEDFINEVASISRTSHVNIVNLLGFCYEMNRRALVYEFMPNKSLDKFIGTNGSLNTNCSLNWETLYNIAVGVARGLEYLHRGCNTRIVHFDIKPQNILLDEDFCPKISDFGLAKLCKKKQSILSMAGARGTIGYIAPEVFSRNFGGVSHKSDVYSYGMMVLEIAGARNFVGLGSMQSSENYFPDKIYELVILSETRNLEAIASEVEEEEATRKMLVGFWCIQTIPSDRPSISKVVEMLEGSLESIQIPPKPFLFTPVSVGQELSPSASGNAETESSIEGEHDS